MVTSSNSEDALDTEKLNQVFHAKPQESLRAPKSLLVTCLGAAKFYVDSLKIHT